MQVVPAEYAFVLHTANPITGAKGEVFGELVQGMGEALVGNHPGRALSFKAGTDGVKVRVNPCCPIYIVRSCFAKHDVFGALVQGMRKPYLAITLTVP